MATEANQIIIQKSTNDLHLEFTDGSTPEAIVGWDHDAEALNLEYGNALTANPEMKITNGGKSVFPEC